MSPIRRAAHVLVLALLPIVLWGWFTAFDGSQWRPHHTVGTIVLLLACVPWAIARYQLGVAFTGRAEARTLVTHGLYRRIRHPIYVFGELTVLGIVVFLGRPIFFAVWAAAIPLQVRRARREEAVLEAAFGDEYRVYKARTLL